jgi:hypothetical protein
MREGATFSPRWYRKPFRTDGVEKPGARDGL